MEKEFIRRISVLNLNKRFFLDFPSEILAPTVFRVAFKFPFVLLNNLFVADFFIWFGQNNPVATLDGHVMEVDELVATLGYGIIFQVHLSVLPLQANYKSKATWEAFI